MTKMRIEQSSGCCPRRTVTADILPTSFLFRSSFDRQNCIRTHSRRRRPP